MNKQVYTYKEGLRDGIPIGLGYLSVSFGFGIAVVAAGLSPLIALLISMSNETSAGQKAGLDIIIACGGFIEMVLTQFIINLRYSLMGISLSQRLDESFSTPWRMLLSFSITDEIFAVASTKRHKVGVKYFAGLASAPYLGWALGTLCGGLLGGILPQRLMNALCIALYGMFVAIVVPTAKKEKPVLLVVLIAMVLSCCFTFLPVLKAIPSGLSVSLCAIAAASVVAAVQPVKEEVA